MPSPVLVFAFLLGPGRAVAKLYERTSSYLGPDFFTSWDFFTKPDPTGGRVRYVSFEEAASAGMVKATPNRVFVGVDRGPVLDGESRRSVRIESHATFNSGLFVATVDHVPTGCGVWPALWMYGDDAQHAWPTWGEFDIVESVHERNSVMTSLHTREDCDQSRVVSNTRWMPNPAGVDAKNCFIYAKGQFANQGCSQLGPNGSMGAELNSAGGGTFAAEWDPFARHMRTWFWHAGTEPNDLRHHRPDPDTWGQPYSFFSLDSEVCSAEHFQNLRLVIDITLCGDFASASFGDDCPVPAQFMTCEEYIRSDPETVSRAYWSIRALDVYQLPSTLRSTLPEPSTNPGSPSPGQRAFSLASVAVVCIAIGFLGFIWYLRRRAHSLNCIRAPHGFPPRMMVAMPEMLAPLKRIVSL